ncbi:MAG TPA: hypothetical protein VF070_22685 [Streptosporangiaceae bacterium]
MTSVKVRRSGISAEDAAEVIRRGLGEGYQVQPSGGAEILVRKGTFGRAKVRLREEPGGTVFDVNGQGYLITMKVANDRGIARRTAEVISQAAEYRDDS